MDEKAIRTLIAQLGDEVFDVREAAEKRLADLGESALDLLEKSARASTDPETRHRADLLVRKLSQRMFFQVRRFEGHGGVKQKWISRVVVSSDGRRAVSAGGDALRSWDLASGKQVGVFESKGAESWGLAFSPDGTKLIAGRHDFQVYVFDFLTGKKLATFSGHTAMTWGVAFSPDGKYGISASDPDHSCLGVATGKEILRFNGVVDEIRCLARSGNLVATGGVVDNTQPGTVRLWDYETGKEVRTLHGHNRCVTSVAFSPDSKMLASASWDRTVRLWDVATGKELKAFTGHQDNVEYAAFTSDGKRVISCGNIFNPTLRLWDVATGKQLLETER